MNKKLYLILTISIALMLSLYLFSSCGDSNSAAGTAGGITWDDNIPAELDNTGYQIRLSNIKLPDLGAGNGHYELWAVLPGPDAIADNPNNLYPIQENDITISMGKFVVTENGQVMNTARNYLFGTTTETAFPPKGTIYYHEPEVKDISRAYKVVISIEPEGDPLENTSMSAPILMGKFNNRIASMVVYAVSNKYFYCVEDIVSETNSGVYTLDTPTSTSASKSSGLWFMNPGEISFEGLYLPSLLNKSSLIYEGWVRDTATGVFYSLGKFSDPVSANTLNPLYYSTQGTGTRYTFPGQDFVQAGNNLSAGYVSGPLNLANGYYRAYVTLEPNPDNSPQPFIFIMESGKRGIQVGPNTSANLFIPSTIDGTAISPGTGLMIKMTKRNHTNPIDVGDPAVDAANFLMLDYPMVKATLE
ncbi:MAG: hypothetical protein BWY64_02934 [bacterium ADurb.Bin363]|nr:MAG: hypothetical protein BWY64_02934 [bacterium ADurb.Bin363]